MTDTPRYVVVPVEPTEEMHRATDHYNPCVSSGGQCYDEADIYAAMLTARPDIPDAVVERVALAIGDRHSSLCRTCEFVEGDGPCDCGALNRAINVIHVMSGDSDD